MINQVDVSLEEIALEAQGYPPKSGERNRLLTKLFIAIQNSHKLARCQSLCPHQLQKDYQEIYADALQKLFLDITNNIDKYNPTKGEFLQWVNGRFKYRFLDAVNDWRPLLNDGYTSLGLEQLSEVDILDEKSPSLYEKIIELIREDPEGVFTKAFTNHNPQANFRYIVLQRDQGYLWEQISQDLDCKVASLSNHYRRSLEKFAPLIREYLQE